MGNGAGLGTRDSGLGRARTQACGVAMFALGLAGGRRRRIRVWGLVGIALVAGCSKGGSQTTGQVAGATRAVPSGSACDRKLVTSAQAADILGAPIVETKGLAGDPQTCELGTAGYASVTISLRPGLGDVTVQTWLDGKMPVSATPLAGVGDHAAWVTDLSEVVATKGNLLCDIQTSGATLSKASVQQKVGALCNRIFAAS